MSKTYRLNLEERSVFLSPLGGEDDEKDTDRERDNTSPLKEARLIGIDRIKPDPYQPRKTFDKMRLESLVESIKETDGIIDPLTVSYDENENVFRIISGERRYRAATMAGLDKLPCIIKAVDQKKTLLFQLITNLQREGLTPLEESAGIRSLIERFDYSQADVARLLNKSQSYISQILGLERLTQPARTILQTSEVAKEVQIQASKEKDPEKQSEILKNASGGKTVRQIRRDKKTGIPKDGEKQDPCIDKDDSPKEMEGVSLRKWIWQPEDRSFVITIQFSKEQKENERPQIVRAALEETLKSLMKSIENNKEDP